MSESKSLAIYNCQTCMFITKNKKDYERHVQSKKHQDSIERKPIIFANVHNDDTTKDDTFQKMPVCPNCKKVYKCRTSVYTHMKKCGVAAAPTPAAPACAATSLAAQKPATQSTAAQMPSPTAASLRTSEVATAVTASRQPAASAFCR